MNLITELIEVNTPQYDQDKIISILQQYGYTCSTEAGTKFQPNVEAFVFDKSSFSELLSALLEDKECESAISQEDVPQNLCKYYIAGTLGSFSTALIELFMKADTENQQKLAEAFPRHYKAYLLWYYK